MPLPGRLLAPPHPLSLLPPATNGNNSSHIPNLNLFSSYVFKKFKKATPNTCVGRWVDEWLERRSAHLKGPGFDSWSGECTSIADWIPDLIGACARGNQSVDVCLSPLFLSPSLFLSTLPKNQWKKYPDDLKEERSVPPKDLKKKCCI